MDGLSQVREQNSEVPIDYLQVDMSDLVSLVDALKVISGRFGTISSIIHTAGVVKDAIISTITPESLQEVIAPKIVGGWNLHLATTQLGLALESFVLLSSIR